MLKSNIWIRVLGLTVNPYAPPQSPTDVSVFVRVQFLDGSYTLIAAEFTASVPLFAPHSTAVLNQMIVDSVVSQINATYGLSISANDVVRQGGFE